MNHHSKKALVISLSNPAADPRPNRVIRLLDEIGYTVDTYSYQFAEKAPVNKRYFIPDSSSYFQLIASRILRYQLLITSRILSDSILDGINNYIYRLKEGESILKTDGYKIIIVEDIQALPVAFSVKGSAKILFDAREYYPKQLEDSIMFQLFDRDERVRLCNQYLKKCDCVVTVSPGLSSEYNNEFGINSEVIRSTPLYYDLTPSAVNHNDIKMVHHGIANSNRKLENMIDIVRGLDDRFTLDFYLTGSISYIEKLKQYAGNISCVRFMDPVPINEIVPMLNKYDIGFYYLEPTGFNVTYNLPNKFFEFIQGRLALALGPSPDMSSLVHKYSCGIVSDKFSITSMIDSLCSLTASDIDTYKCNSDIAAKDLNYNKEMMKLRDIINEIVHD